MYVNSEAVSPNTFDLNWILTLLVPVGQLLVLSSRYNNLQTVGQSTTNLFLEEHDILINNDPMLYL